MKKDAYWFSHDSNSRNDVKLVKLRRLHGLEGIGLFWCVVEMLREAKDYELSIESIDDIAYELRTDTSVFESMFQCGLFEKKGEIFYSQSLKHRMVEHDRLKEKRRVAGAKGGKAKASNAKKTPSNAKECSSKATAKLKQTHSIALANPTYKIIEDNIREDNNKKDTPLQEEVSVSHIDHEKEERFEKFWVIYDYRKEKKKAKANFMRLSERQLKEVSMNIVKYVKNTFTDGTFPSRMYPAKYLNPKNELWNDDVVDSSTQNKGQPKRDEYKEPDFDVSDFLVN